MWCVRLSLQYLGNGARCEESSRQAMHRALLSTQIFAPCAFAINIVLSTGCAVRRVHARGIAARTVMYCLNYLGRGLSSRTD